MLYQFDTSLGPNCLPTIISASLEKFFNIAALATACDDVLSAKNKTNNGLANEED